MIATGNSSEVVALQESGMRFQTWIICTFRNSGFHRFEFMNMKKSMFLAALGCWIAVGFGCANRQSQMGVENLWRADPAPAFEIGRSTQSEVMKALGPPSQVIALGEQTLFYYLREQQKLQSLSLIIYSHSRERIIYDRAIFFFDREGMLRDFALSEEEIPRRDKKAAN
jgi:hypothetical protein